VSYKKILITFSVIVIIILTSFCIKECYINDRIQSEINTKFMSDYGNLIIGMLNKSIQTDKIVIHKYNKENTKYGFRLTELYPHNSHLKHKKFEDIIYLLDQASGCDAWYEINMDKALYDKLNALGQAIFSQPQRYTDEMLEDTYNALSEAVDFNVKTEE